MVVIILGSLLIAAVAFYQAIQGTFSALIMTVLTVVCSVVALNFYEPAAQALIGRLGAYAHAVCLLALFVVPLLALRELFDRLVRGNVILGLWIDRIGGAVLGAVTGLLLPVKFAYALTCHKTQGGQWPTVFIEQPFLPEGEDISYLRWLYTGITRAQNQLFLIGFPDEYFEE